MFVLILLNVIANIAAFSVFSCVIYLYILLFTVSSVS